MRERTLRIYLDVGCVKNNNNEHSDAEGKKNTNEQRTDYLLADFTELGKEGTPAVDDDCNRNILLVSFIVFVFLRKSVC